jgi:hypothetical protein
MEFGRFAAENRAIRGKGKPETFNFLGFTHISGKDRNGRFMLIRKTRRDRMTATLKAIKDGLRRRWHYSIPEQGKWLRRVVQGYLNYHSVPGNFHHAEVQDTRNKPLAPGAQAQEPEG